MASRRDGRDDVALRPPCHRRTDRRAIRLRPRGWRLLRADRVEPRADPGRKALLPLRVAVGAAAPAGEAAPAAGLGLALAGLARRVPRPPQTRAHAHRPGREPDPPHRLP